MGTPWFSVGVSTMLVVASLAHQAAAARLLKDAAADGCAALPPHAATGSVFKDAGGAWRFEEGVHDGEPRRTRKRLGVPSDGCMKGCWARPPAVGYGVGM